MTVMKIKKQNKIKNKRKKIWMIFTKKRILKTKNLIMIMKDIKMKCFINRNKEKNKNLMKIIILNRIMRNLNNNTKISTSTNRIRKMIGIIYINKKKLVIMKNSMIILETLIMILVIIMIIVMKNMMIFMNMMIVGMINMIIEFFL